MTQTQAGRTRGPLSSAKIIRRRELTPDLWRMWLEPAQPFTFKAGQYITIGVDGIERPYSIASSPSEPAIELFIELIPSSAGALTPLLYKLGVGDRVAMRPRAKGVFLFNPNYKHHVMVSTVTGVAPFISMLRDYFERTPAGHRFYLLEGASYRDEFGYDDELTRLAEERDDFVFVPSVSRPHEERNAGWSGESGRINTVIEKYLEKLKLRPEDTLVYACGHPLMIEDVKKRLAGTGFKVIEERFWREDE